MTCEEFNQSGMYVYTGGYLPDDWGYVWVLYDDTPVVGLEPYEKEDGSQRPIDSGFAMFHRNAVRACRKAAKKYSERQQRLSTSSRTEIEL
jgi:hypothetical protein